MSVEPDIDADDPLVGTTFVGRYRIDGVLGRGGMGAVYRATQLAVDRPVAIKILLPDLAHRAKMAQRFRQEAELVAKLQHPNIIALHDFGEDEAGRLFLVMELLAGRPLTDLIEEAEAAGAPLEPTRIASILRQTLDALAEAHARGIVHRDLKPDNIFIADGGRRGDVVKILDFGIAKITAADDDAGLTKTGAILGTARYMAPEQALAKPVDGRTDLYALGAILYEMIAGRPVFDGETVTELLVSHCTVAPPPVTRGALAVSGALVDLAMACLAKDPADRPASAEAMLAMLDAAPRAHLLTGGPNRAGRAGRPTSTRPPRRTSPLVWAIVALVVVGAGVAVALIAGRPSTTGATTTPSAVPAPVPDPDVVAAAPAAPDAVVAAAPDTAPAPDAAPEPGEVVAAADDVALVEVEPEELTLERYEALVLATAGCELTKDAVDWRCPAQKALTDATGKGAWPPGRDALGLKLLAHEAPAVRFAAVHMVSGSAPGRAALAEAARKETEPKVLRHILRAVGNSGMEPPVGELILWASRHADPIVREQAAWGLANTWNKGLPGATERLIELMADDPAEEVRVAACDSAGALGDEVFMPIYTRLTADTSNPKLHGACMSGLIKLWYDYPFFAHGSEKAYKLTLQRLGQKPRSDSFPEWGLPGRFAHKADGFVRWTMKHPWWKPAALRKVLTDIAVDLDVNWLARVGAIDSLVTHEATRAELEALRKRCADNTHVQQHIDKKLVDMK